MSENSTSSKGSAIPLACHGLAEDAPRYNLRDYGGYATAGGGRLRSGVLLRSGQLDDVGPTQKGLLVRLGVRIVIDMRGPGEIPSTRSAIYDGYRGEILVARSEDNIVPHASRGLVSIKDPAEVTRQMREVYRRLPFCARFQESLANYFMALDSIGAAGQGSTLVHCYAGKDRTGLAVALFHLLAGVAEDDVIADYLMTNEMGQERVEMARPAIDRNIDGDAPEWLLGALMAVEAEYLAAALELISPAAEGPLRYLCEVTDLPEAKLRQIAEIWTE